MGGLHKNVGVVLLDELPYCSDKEIINPAFVQSPSMDQFSFYAKCKGCVNSPFCSQCGFTTISEVFMVRRRGGMSYND